ncbi:hypothetical protein [Amycolatopsis anabasis]|uniref:hypothetical protein n=1 Tax=Amycolatopsis anabasis TaxID=1840409 RepID=UPI00131C9142|nr:hypothetical protein [Amycolatopsis anabasis]
MTAEVTIAPPIPGAARSATPAAAGAPVAADVVLTWDRWSGWAHLARHRRGDSAKPAFAGFAQVADPETAEDDVRARLTASGLTVMSAYSVDEQLVEFRIAPEGSSR